MFAVTQKAGEVVWFGLSSDVKPAFTSGHWFIELDTSTTFVANGAAWVPSAGGSAAWGGITGTLSSQTDLQTALDAKLDDSQATAFGLSFLNDADAAAGRATLALGTLATQSGTFSGTSSGTNTGDQASIVGITGSLAEFNTALTGADFATGGGTATGTNTGDQTSIAGITGTKAQFDTAVSDGNILYVGDITQYTDEAAQDAVGGMVDASLSYADATPLLQRAALTGAVTASAGSNATLLGSFTTAQFNAALSDGDLGGGGDIALNKHILAANFTVTAAYASYIPRYLEIGATFALEVGAGADMEIG